MDIEQRRKRHFSPAFKKEKVEMIVFLEKLLLSRASLRLHRYYEIDKNSIFKPVKLSTQVNKLT